jgi:hypothetical protein
MRLGPGAPATGFLIAAAFAVLAHCGALGAEAPVWDDLVFLTSDTRVHELSSVFTSFGDSFFGALRRNEMYRPLVNASFAFDWWISGSSPGDVRLWWFHLVNVLLHAANAGLAYLFLVNLTTRRLGAPLLAACLFAVHPLATEPVGWLVGRGDLIATLFGLLSGIFLLRSPGHPRRIPPALLFFALSLFAKASAALLPVVVALGIVAYRELPWSRLLGKRLLPRFLLFAVPAGIWIAARWAVLGAPFPVSGGRLWHDVGLRAGVLGVGRAFAILAGQIVLPARLCGDYAEDPAFHPQDGGAGALGVAGLLLLIAMTVVGCRWLRSRPKLGCPLLAFVLLLLPVLQLVPIGAVVADRFMYLPMLFTFLLVGEGLERAFLRVHSPAMVAITFAVFLMLGLQSHVRAEVWSGPVPFNEDVLQSYPHARNATNRLAVAYFDSGRREEAIELLQSAVERFDHPDEETNYLGALLLEAGDLEAAEPVLRRAVDLAGRKRLLGARTRYNLAVLLKNTERPDEARELLEAALIRAPALVPARDLLRKLGPE